MLLKTDTIEFDQIQGIPADPNLLVTFLYIFHFICSKVNNIFNPVKPKIDKMNF